MKLIINWDAEAFARGHEPTSCDECCGRGELTLGPSAAHPQATTEPCLECAGSGQDHGECPCGLVGPLMPTAGMLVCAKCAASCVNCGERLSVACDLDDHDPVCLTCWREFATLAEDETGAAIR